MNIKAVIFDADGVVINSPGYFSVQYQKDFGISNDILLPFFKGRFQECLIGDADLKEELKPLLKKWKWKGTVDELLNYWFKSEHYIDDRVINEIKRLRAKGIKCYLGTKQEKYRMEYIKKDMGLEEFFDGIFSSDHMGYKKPDKRFYEFVSSDLEKTENIKPENIMFWDDKKENVDSASEFGWKAYLFVNFEEFRKIISKSQTMKKSAGAFFIYDKKILMLQRDNNPDTYNPSCWQLIGGEIEAGETPEQALIREADEEINIQIQKNIIKKIGKIIISDEQEYYLYWVQLGNTQAKEIKLGNEGVDLKFIPVRKIVELKMGKFFANYCEKYVDGLKKLAEENILDKESLGFDEEGNLFI